MARKLLIFCVGWTFLVVTFGAYVRLSDSGLGCPDWPTCYGLVIGVPETMPPGTSNQPFPASPPQYDADKAWIEVIHRYIAGMLGVMVVIATVLARREGRRRLFIQLLVANALIIGQAIWGMLTVTQQLMPLTVTVHLLGGMLILGYLAFCAVPQPAARRPPTSTTRLVLYVFAALLVAQIALGGWVSSNYARWACPDFPTCHGEWIPPHATLEGFHPGRALGQTAQGDAIGANALSSIHMVHRAVALLLVVAALGLGAYLHRTAKSVFGWILLLMVGLQFIIGVLVVGSGGVPPALFHNVGASFLVVAVAVMLRRLH